MTLTRAAASSIASGRRSSRAHSWAIVASVSSLGTNSGRRCLARSTNRRCASSGPSGSSLQTVSPSTPSDSRLVAMIRTLGARGEQGGGELGARVHDVLAVVEDEQQVAVRQVRGAAPRSGSSHAGRERPASGPSRPRRRACRDPPRGPRARRRRPAARSDAGRAPRARRVFPTPPGPVSVTRRVLRSVSPIPSSSRARPTSDVSGTGRLCSAELARSAVRDEVVAIAMPMITQRPTPVRGLTCSSAPCPAVRRRGQR